MVEDMMIEAEAARETTGQRETEIITVLVIMMVMMIMIIIVSSS